MEPVGLIDLTLFYSPLCGRFAFVEDDDAEACFHLGGVIHSGEDQLLSQADGDGHSPGVQGEMDMHFVVGMSEREPYAMSPRADFG